MKIIAETGERILIIVPARLGSSVMVSIETDSGARVADVRTQDGLILDVTEHVVRRTSEFVPYPNDCGSCHGKPLDEVALCRDCNGTGEHQS